MTLTRSQSLEDMEVKSIPSIGYENAELKEQSKIILNGTNILQWHYYIVGALQSKGYYETTLSQSENLQRLNDTPADFVNERTRA